MGFGLALSGGGVRGAVHIGVLKAFEENGLKPNLISGNCAGAIVASLYSVGYTPDEIKEIVIANTRNIIIDFDMKEVFYYLKSLMINLDKKIDGLIKGDKIKKILAIALAEKNCTYISDTKIPLAICSVDIDTAKLIIFISNKKGIAPKEDISYIDNIELATAIRASLSYPVLFKPCIYDGKRLVDGGIRKNLPVDILKQMGAEKVIAVNLGWEGKTTQDIDDIIEIGVQSLDVMASQISKDEEEKADYVLRPKVYDINMFDAKKINECVQRGYDLAISKMNKIKKIL